MTKGLEASEIGKTKPIADLPYLFTTAEALAKGIPSSTFHRLAQRGDIHSIARGLYSRDAQSTVDLDLVEIASKAPSATICLTSALVEHDLSDAIPKKLHIAIPRGAWAPRTTAAVAWHRFDPEKFNLGRGERPIPGTDLTIGIYTPERTLADLARHPNLDQAELIEGIRRWLRKPGNHPANLLKVARRLPGARYRIQTILEILS
ncbi:MAG TPA: type IV toxin-antitoxin system AbiEi family antitoxin domain-containing protein [Candidatus Paceibacterota bacterium]|nr:type IV toxin-antitoxin system AbiEi family antitoxin domain-containing protein [Candidatus Paceibacterota bacterium]